MVDRPKANVEKHEDRYRDADGRPNRAYWEERLPELRRQTDHGIENLRRIGEGLPPKPYQKGSEAG